MRRRWTAPSIRVRLTGWYAVVLTVMMIVYATATFIAVRYEVLKQLDRQLHDEFEAAEGLLIRTPDGRVAWDGNRHHDPDSDEAGVYEVWSADGQQVYRSGASVVLPPVALASTGTSYRYETVVANGDRWRTITEPITIGGHAVVLRVS